MRSPLLLCIACIAIALAPSPAQARSKKKHAPLEPAQQAGELVAASAPAALLLDGARATEGLAALLSAAAPLAPSLAPSLVARDLVRALGVDPLTSGAQSGLAAEGARAIVFDARAEGFSAPIADEALAKRALQAWLSQLGPVRPTRSAPLKGPLASGGGDEVRAGMIAPVAGGLRLLTASGRGAAALVAQLAHVGRKAQDNPPIGGTPTISAALSAVPGPLRLWLRGEGPLLGALVALDASAAGLSAHGLLLPATGAPALLDGTAPPESACTPAPLLCARAAPGPALRALAPLVLRELIARDLLGGPRDALDGLLQAELSAARGPVLLRVESLEARALGDPAQLLAALPASISSGAAQPDAAPAPGPAPATDSAGATPPAAPGSATVPPGVKPLPSSWTELPAPRRGLLLSAATQLCLQSQEDAFWLSSPCAPLPAHFGDAGGARELAATLDTRALARSLASLTALDGFRGSLAAGAFAVKLLWGDLLASSGPVSLQARPSPLGDAPRAPLAGALELSFAWPLSPGAVAK